MRKINLITLMLFTALSYAQLGVNGNIIEINKEMVGLGNIDNTSDDNKPVSVATLAALNLKTDIASPIFTGTPILPTGTIGTTQAVGDNSTALATTAFVTAAITTTASDVSDLEAIIYNDQAAPSLTIGDYIGGGIVFWVDPNDATQGFVCAVDNQSTGIQWYNGVYTVTGASGTAIGTGAANTTAIISAQGLTEVNYAAGLARAHNGGGFTDWFLPSKDALHHIYTNRVTINTKAVENGGAASFTNGYYWTSTQSGSNVAAYQHFANGSQYYIDTNTSFYVRAVRAVSSLATSSLSTITS
jgi:hypothetical protein